MRSFIVAGAAALTCCLSVYGCTPAADDSGSEAGAAGTAGTAGGKGGTSGASGKGTGATSGKNGSGGSSSGSAGEGANVGESGTSSTAGGAGETGVGGSGGGRGGSSNRGGSSGSGGSSGRGGSSTTQGGETGVGDSGGASGGDNGDAATGNTPFVCTPASPGTVTWSDGFETGGLDWDITGGVWAIGAPTAPDGPAAYEGTNVAGTVLGGDYGASADAWLITPDIDVPAAKNHPRFAFRYWYELAAGDAAYVYVRVGTGSWQNLFSLTESGDGDWRNMVLPLDAYADETVQFGFRLITNTAAFAAGFYVDDTRVITGDIGMGNCEDFEHGWDGWSSTGSWDVGAPTASDGPAAFDGTKVAGTILSGDYGSSDDVWLISPQIEVPAAKQEPRFSYDYWYQLASGDTAYTYLRVNHGSWQNISTVHETGDGSWRNLTFPLGAYADETVEFGFRLITDTAAFAPGYYIDNARFETGPVSVTKKEGFENGWDGWSAYNGVWAVGKPTASDGPDPHGGENVAGTILSGDYGNSDDAWLVSPRVFVPENASAAKASYWYWYNLASGDNAYAYIRVDGGSWQNIDTLSSAADDTWRQHQVDLSSYVDHTIELGFRLITNTSTYAPGFYIDDVSFTLD